MVRYELHLRSKSSRSDQDPKLATFDLPWLSLKNGSTTLEMARHDWLPKKVRNRLQILKQVQCLLVVSVSIPKVKVSRRIQRSSTLVS